VPNWQFPSRLFRSALASYSSSVAKG